MPIITLTTDFGLRDHFTGVIKGVICEIAPKATIVDIAHELTPFATTEAAFVIAESFRFFPKKTVHVVVVDPGVGTARRPILVEAAGQYFIGPDNGVLSMVYSRTPAKVREITNARLFLPSVSQTFHGRDIFAPVAAYLASRKTRPQQVGRLIDDYLRPHFDKPTRTGTRCWAGSVLKVDRFGNLITCFHVEDFPNVRTRPIVMISGVTRVEGLVNNYAEGPFGAPSVIVGSSGYLEVCVNQGSAAHLLGCVAGSPVELSIY
jgi:S-adenosylmethionine hydrolase